MVANIEESAELKDTNTLLLKSSDGVFSNYKSKKSLKRTRKEMALKSTLESSLKKVEELLTESPLNTSRTRPTE